MNKTEISKTKKVWYWFLSAVEALADVLMPVLVGIWIARKFNVTDTDVFYVVLWVLVVGLYVPRFYRWYMKRKYLRQIAQAQEEREALR